MMHEDHLKPGVWQHPYHRECWLRATVGDANPTCPTCRQVVNRVALRTLSSREKVDRAVGYAIRKAAGAAFLGTNANFLILGTSLGFKMSIMFFGRPSPLLRSLVVHSSVAVDIVAGASIVGGIAGIAGAYPAEGLQLAPGVAIGTAIPSMVVLGAAQAYENGVRGGPGPGRGLSFVMGGGLGAVAIVGGRVALAAAARVGNIVRKRMGCLKAPLALGVTASIVVGALGSGSTIRSLSAGALAGRAVAATASLGMSMLHRI